MLSDCCQTDPDEQASVGHQTLQGGTRAGSYWDPASWCVTNCRSPTVKGKEQQGIYLTIICFLAVKDEFLFN